MKTTNIPWIIIIGLILFISWDRGCNNPDPPDPIVITRVDTIPGDSIPVPYPVLVPSKPILIEVPVTLPTIVDTMAILKDYFAKVSGRDTLANDTSVLVIIDWLVSQNRIQEITPYIANRRPIAIITETTIINPVAKPFKYGIGGGMGLPSGYYLSASYGPNRLKARTTYFKTNQNNHILVGLEYIF